MSAEIDETVPAPEHAPLAATEPTERPRVGIVVSSRSEMPVMEKAGQELEELGIPFETKVLPAHRDPAAACEYARSARERGLRVIIAGSAMSSLLPSLVAAHTDLPVIGVPIAGLHSPIGGLDTLVAIAQMPAGLPVATVGVDAAINAAVLAARILHC